MDEDQHVPFVALDGFGGLDEEPAQPVVGEAPVQVGTALAGPADGGLDRVGLRLAEGHDAQAQVGPGVVVVDHALGHPRGLVRVVPGGSPPVGALVPEQLRTPALGPSLFRLGKVIRRPS